METDKSAILAPIMAVLCLGIADEPEISRALASTHIYRHRSLGWAC